MKAAMLIALCLFAACEQGPTEEFISVRDRLMTRVPVAVDRGALDEFVGHATAGDNAAKAVMVADGRVFRVENPTRVRIMGGGGFGAARVNIMEGEWAGRTVFVPSEWVRSRPAE